MLQMLNEKTRHTAAYHSDHCQKDEEMYYHSLNEALQETYNCKVYKLSLETGCTCPNRDQTKGTGGCIFCSQGGSGEFAAPRGLSIHQQIESAKKRVENKSRTHKYIAYFQSFSNTYGHVSYLEPLFTEAILHPEIVALSIATRPDCFTEEIYSMLNRLQKIKPVWIELGLQTIHPRTAELIHRAYELCEFEEAVNRLAEMNILVVTHMILGLPGESREDMLESVTYLGTQKVNGVKFSLLHVLRNTVLADMYEKGEFETLEMDAYIDILADCILRLPREVVIHRLTGDGPKSLLIAPMWSANKRAVLNAITRTFSQRDICQGSDRRALL